MGFRALDGYVAGRVGGFGGEADGPLSSAYGSDDGASVSSVGLDDEEVLEEAELSQVIEQEYVQGADLAAEAMAQDDIDDEEAAGAGLDALEPQPDVVDAAHGSEPGLAEEEEEILEEDILEDAADDKGDGVLADAAAGLVDESGPAANPVPHKSSHGGHHASPSHATASSSTAGPGHPEGLTRDQLRSQRKAEALAQAAEIDRVLEGEADDGTCGRMRCRPHGFCSRGHCVCAAAYEGRECEHTKKLGHGLHARFDGNFVLNQKHVTDAGGIKLKTNPKAGAARQGGGHGGTHTLDAPLVDRDSAQVNRQFRNGKSTVSERRTKSVITPKLLSVMPREDFLHGVVFNRCAIVGSSGLSLLYHDGPAIDEHDVVIRFNSAPTVVKPRGRARRRAGAAAGAVSYVAHVGRKTTFRFINTQHIRFFEGREIRIQQMQSKNGLIRYFMHRNRYRKSRLHAFDTDFTQYVSSNIPFLPTGGYFAVNFAMQLCVEVNKFGFHWRPGHAIPHHYFNSEVPLEGKEKIHDYDAEHANLLHLARAGMLHISQPCAAGCEARTGIACDACAAGSTCGCGDNMPTPLSLPGFCHKKGNYTCFYRCPKGAAQCPGGPSHSRCPRTMDAFLAEEGRHAPHCAGPDDIPDKFLDGVTRGRTDLPKWMTSHYHA